MIAPVGDIDFATAAAAFHLPLCGPGIVVTVDLAGVTFIDAFGLGDLVRLRNDVRASGAMLDIVGVPPRIASVFRLAQLDRII